MLAKQVNQSQDSNWLAPAYGARALSDPVPKYELPQTGMDGDLAYQLIHDELQLDGNPALNLASFVTTWMEPQAAKLMDESLGRNFVDADEYPRTTDIQNRCVNILGRLFHAPKAVGCATIGSSEAIHLAGLALKWRWKAKRAAKGLDTDKPNIVMGANVQVCWEKFARYFDVEPRYVPLTEDRYVLGVPDALNLIDDRTIAVVAILGSTYTGEYEPVQELSIALEELSAKGGPDVPIHVDAASGGFVAPFSTPDLLWDFRLERVRSINVSGHKYGLVYPGVGWAIWRTPDDLPQDLIFHVNYLGGDQPTFNLNFSRASSQIIAQYYNFLRLGRSGYVQIIGALQSISEYISKSIASDGHFDVISKSETLPLVCFRLKSQFNYTAFDVSSHLRSRGWIVPAYTLAADAQDITVLRVVVKEGLSRDMADMLLADLDDILRLLDESTNSDRHLADKTNAHRPARTHQPAAVDVKHLGSASTDNKSAPSKSSQEESTTSHGVC